MGIFLFFTKRLKPLVKTGSFISGVGSKLMISLDASRINDKINILSERPFKRLLLIMTLCSQFHLTKINAILEWTRGSLLFLHIVYKQLIFGDCFDCFSLFDTHKFELNSISTQSHDGNLSCIISYMKPILLYTNFDHGATQLLSHDN